MTETAGELSDAGSRLAVKAGHIGVWQLDLRTYQLTCSATFKEHLGRDPTADLGYAEFLTSIDATHVGRVTGSLQRSIEQGTDFETEFPVFCRAPGVPSIRWVELKAEVELAAGGAALRIVGVSLDITRRRSSGADMQRTEMLLKAVLETASGLIYAKDLTGRMLIANPPTLALIGKPWSEVQGRTDAEFLDDRTQGEAIMATDRRVMAGGRIEVLEETVGSVDGHPCVWLSTKAPLRDDGGAIVGLVGVSQNITDRKRFQAKLVEANETLEARVIERTQALEAEAALLASANKELESFSYSVSHDLRAPLRAIDGFALMIQEDQSERLDAEGRRHLSTIRDNIQRMGLLIDDLLAFSRLSRASIAAQEVNVESLVHDVLAHVRHAQPHANVQFDIGALPRVRCDRSMLSHVWTNLISNAIKYSSRNAAPKIEISGELRGAEAIYSVRDNGVGFDMKYAGKLFGVFQRLHRNEEFSGTGVGLAIAHRIVTRHGGRMWAEGKIDEGAAFYFTLPTLSIRARDEPELDT